LKRGILTGEFLKQGKLKGGGKIDVFQFEKEGERNFFPKPLIKTPF